MPPHLFATFLVLAPGPNPVEPPITRSAAALVVGRSPSFAPVRSFSEMLALVTEVFEAETVLAPSLVPEGSVEECRRENSSASLLFCEVRIARKVAGRTGLLIYVLGTSETEVRLSFLPLQTVAEAVDDEPETSSGDDEARAPEALDVTLERSVRKGAIRTAQTAEALRRVLREAIRTEMADVFLTENRNLFRSTGRLLVEVKPDGPRVRLDGRDILVSAPATFELIGTPVGAHVLELSMEGFRPKTKAFDMPAEEDLPLSFELKPDQGTARDIMWVSGLGVVAAGLVVGGLGIDAMNSRDPVNNAQYLLRVIESSPEGSEDRLPSLSGGRGEGPTFLGLSSGLIGTGASLFAFGVFDGQQEDREVWIDVLISVGVGLALYGTSEIIDLTLD